MIIRGSSWWRKVTGSTRDNWQPRRVSEGSWPGPEQPLVGVEEGGRGLLLLDLCACPSAPCFTTGRAPFRPAFLATFGGLRLTFSSVWSPNSSSVYVPACQPGRLIALTKGKMLMATMKMGGREDDRDSQFGLCSISENAVLTATDGLACLLIQYSGKMKLVKMWVVLAVSAAGLKQRRVSFLGSEKTEIRR